MLSSCVEDKPIVELIGISLQLSGTTRRELESAVEPHQIEERAAAMCPVFFDNDRILAFALGKPVQAFGEAYRPFENGRFLARLPAPPFQCVHRIMSTDAKPWVMEAGTHAVAEYDIDPDAWFFEADRRRFAAAGDSSGNRACSRAAGWRRTWAPRSIARKTFSFATWAARRGSTGASLAQSGTLSTRVKVTKITSAAGMILQWYEFAVESSERARLRRHRGVRLLSPARDARPGRHP